MEVASAFVSLVPTARGFGKGIERQIGGDVRKAGESGGKQYATGMGSSLKGAAGRIFAPLAAAAAGVGIASFFKDAVAGASDLNESATKTEAIFGAGTAAVQAFAKQGGAALGQTRNNVLDAAATFGTFGKAAGLSGTDLAKFSTDFVGLSTDLASFNNTSPEEAVEAIGSALRGEAEPMRRYGVLLDDATLRNAALRLGLIKTTKDALTPQQKVLAAQAEIYRQTNDAQGDFQRTSGGLANQQRILSATFADLRTNIGVALLPVVLRITKGMAGFVSQLQTGEGIGGRVAAVFRQVGAVAGQAFKVLFEGDFTHGPLAEDSRFVDALFRLRDAFGAVAAFVMRNHDVLLPLVAIIGSAVAAYRVAVAVTTAYAAVQAVLNGVLVANPIGVVVVALAALAAVLVVAYKRSETFRTIVQGAWSGIATAVSATWGFLRGVFSTLGSWLDSAGAAFTRFGEDLAGAWASAQTGASTVQTTFVGFGQAVASVWSSVQAAVSTAWGVIRGVFSAIARVLSGPLGVAFAIFRQVAVTVFEVWRAVVVVAWAIVSKVFSAIYTWVRGRLVAAFNVFAGIARTVWGVVRNAVTAAWAVVSPILSAIYTWVRTRLVAAFNFYSGVARTVWAAVRTAITAAWRVVSPVFTTLKRWIDTTLPGAFNTGKSLITARFNAVRTAVTDAWNKHVKPAFNAMTTAIQTTLPNAFSKGAGAIKTAWDKVKDYAKAPVRFVIETVLNRGILAAFNRVSEAVLGKDAGKVHINSIPLPAGFAQGTEDHRAQIARAGQMRLWAEPETGGEAYIPLSARKRARSTHILGQVARRFGYNLTQFADGGILGRLLGGLDPRKLISGGLDRLRTIPGAGSPFAQAIAGVPRRLLGMLVDKVKSLVTSAVGEVANLGGEAGAGAGMGFNRQMAILRRQFPGLQLISGFRRNAITATGNRSYHAQGRAVDIPPRMELFNWIRANYGRSTKELIFSPAGARQVWNGRPHMYTGITRANHWDHVHWAMANGGFVPPVRYDRGGWLRPGVSMVENRTGKPEAVFNPQQLSALAGGGGLTFNGPVFTQSPEEFAREVESRRRLHEALHPTFV